MNKQVRKLISRVGYGLGLLSLALWFYRRLHKRPVLAVFVFHRIIAGPPDENHLQGYERGVSLAAFRRQLELISRFFKIIDHRTFFDIVTGRKLPADSRPMALLTFDDADSGHSEAFRLMAEDNLPGLSFAPTAFVDTERRFYHLRLTNLCNNLTNSDWLEIQNAGLPKEIEAVLTKFLPDVVARRLEFRQQLIAPFGQMNPPPRDRLLDTWEKRINGVYDLGIECMSWDSIRHWHSRNIVVGSHTVNHNRLALLSEEEQVAELAESRARLELEVGQPVTAICYPEGSYCEATLFACEKTGYELGFTVISRLVDYPLTGRDLYLIPRIGLGDGADHEMSFTVWSQVVRQCFQRIDGRRGAKPSRALSVTE